ncbi:DNA alkylation repair protein [soil metagenome]
MLCKNLKSGALWNGVIQKEMIVVKNASKMGASEVMDELESLGAEQTRKTYRRHGATEPIFGVSFANLEKLKKKLKVDQDLAQKLWATGNHDARILAMMIADPQLCTEELVERWAQDLTNYTLTDALVGLVGRTPFAQAKAEVWSRSDNEWMGSAGWQLLGHLALHDAALPDAYFTKQLARIEQEIHTRKNRVRYAMNNTLITIGVRNAALEPEARAVAQRIGKVEVDHGETNCKTPDAVAYIQKTLAYRQKKAATKLQEVG